MKITKVRITNEEAKTIMDKINLLQKLGIDITEVELNGILREYWEEINGTGKK